MDRQQEAEESCDPTEFKFRSRPLTAGGTGIENGIRFFTKAMHALDRIEGALSEIEQTRTLVHQMIGEFSLARSGVRVPRLTPDGEGQRKKLKPERKELTEKDVCTPRIHRRSRPKRNKTLLEICEEWKKKHPGITDDKFPDIS